VCEHVFDGRFQRRLKLCLVGTFDTATDVVTTTTWAIAGRAIIVLAGGSIVWRVVELHLSMSLLEALLP
jgi:hypothetical protein